MRRIRVYLPAIIVLLVSTVFSQTPSFNFQKLGSEEGLNNANIFNIEQHANGLLYFTTQNGIYTYDGYTFTKLEVDSLRSNALITASIKNENEVLLSLRDEGIATLDLAKHVYKKIPALSLSDNNADNIVLTERFAFLLISRIKVVIIDLKTGKVIQDQLKKQENLAYCIYRHSDGRVLLGRSDGLYDITSGTQIKLAVSENLPIYAITQDRAGKLYLGSAGKILVLANDKLEKTIEPVYRSTSTTFLPDGLARSINKIVVDDFGRIWFTSYPEENLYLYANNSVYDVFEALNIPPSLIKCVFKDNEQNIWVGTNNDGLYFIQNAFFNSFNFSFAGKNLNINQVFIKDQLLVAATNNGLYGFNLNTYQAKVLSKPDEVFLEPIYSVTENNGIIYYSKVNELNLFPSIFVASNKNYKFRPVIAKIFCPIGANKSVLADWNLNILLADEEGTKIYDTLISFSDYRLSVNALTVFQNKLYIGTSSGLITYDFEKKKQESIRRPELNFNINDFCAVDNKLYVAHDGGITEVGSRLLIEKINGSNLNSVRRIKNHNNQIWIGTLDGVLICDKQFNLLKVLNKASGLLSNSINDISFSENSVGIATARGVSISDLAGIVRHSSKLKPVTIESVSSMQKIVLPIQNKYNLEANQENVSIKFFSPVFARPNKQTFRWKIDESEWQYFSNTSIEVVLSGGKHVIAIQASADNVEWSESTILQFDKEEKLSETSSGYILYSALGSIVVFLISFVWVRRIKIKSKRRLAEEQQVNLLKHQAMNALLSPHFIFNSLTSIQNYINTNNGLRASEYLAKFSRLIRMIIEKAAQSHITLHDELARLTYYLELEKERFKNKFDYHIQLDEGLNTNAIEIPNMIIQPYVENCIIHGILPKQQHGELWLSFKMKQEKVLSIVIEDNGIGLIKAREHAKTGHKSLGTSTIQSILDINSKLSGKKQKVVMRDKSLDDPSQSGTIIEIDLEL